MDFVLNHHRDVLGDRVMFADATNICIQPLHEPVRCLVKHGEPKAPQEARAEARDVEREANTRSAEPEPQGEAWLLE